MLQFEDYEAAEQLASDIPNAYEAMKWLRTESAKSLVECAHWVMQIARKYPESPLAAHTKRCNFLPPPVK